MHLYMMTRGTVRETSRLIEDLTHVYMPVKTKKAHRDKYPNSKVSMIQLSVRPVQLFELVFPEEQLTNVMKTLGPCAAGLKGAKLLALRKALHATPLPKIEYDGILTKISKYAVSKHYIGTKKDRYDENGDEQL